MPIVVQHIEPRRRGTPWWLLAFSLMLLLPAGFFVWTLFHPIVIVKGSRVLRIGGHARAGLWRPGFHTVHGGWVLSLPLKHQWGYLVGHYPF